MCREKRHGRGETVRIAVIEGSMRKEMHTAGLVARVLDAMGASEPEIEILRTAEMSIEACRVVCSSYCSSHPFRCSIPDDAMNALECMQHADTVLLATPLYFRAPPARFHTLMERLISLHFFRESQRIEDETRPLSGKPCGLVAVTEYSSPQGLLEYLADVSRLLGLAPVMLNRFPYLGVGAEGDPEKDRIFDPLGACAELASRLVVAAAH